MTAVPGPAVREQLRDVTWTAIDLNRRLEEVVAVPTSKTNSGIKRGRIDHSQPPWNTPVAHLVMEMHSLARDLEDLLRCELGMAHQIRGGDDKNTIFALRAIASLGESSLDKLVVDVARQIARWNSRALVVLGDRDLPKHLPRDVGRPEPRCPYCACLTLRFWSARGEVRCVNPACFDETERRPAARMDYSIVAREWVLVWRDGSVGVPEPDAVDERIAG